ncbi:hypothetical protein HHI36_003474 [Cryptolaemus montrouzieri]|uniref:Uncharacterized protein n=1 Tax=Cryptolaemus montrouzieri TaxID=559131 RepID=A0ABD2PE14_9CUCU
MSFQEELLKSRIQHPPERLTLFSICCPCLRPKKLKCRASDIALLMYGKDEPHEYVVEKLVIKRLPLRIFGVEEDFLEYEKSLRESKISNEKEIAVTNFEAEKLQEIVEEIDGHASMKQVPQESVTHDKTKKSVQVVTDATSGNSLCVNYNTPIEEFLTSKLSLGCEPLTEPKSGEELMLRTITANDKDGMVTEVDQRIAKMSPDLEKTINTLKAVKPRPVSTKGLPMPIKNQKKRLTCRNIEHEGIITKEAYNYAPCVNDHPLQGIHYTLNKTTFTPVVEEESKSVITELPMETIGDQTPKTKTSLMVEEATTNYEDATVLAVPEESSTICPSTFHLPSTKSISDRPDYLKSDYSSDSTNCLGSFGPRRFKNIFHTYHRRRNDFGDTDFNVYHAEMVPMVGGRITPPIHPKKKNLRWKIVINNHSKETAGPTTSSSDFQLPSRRHCPKRRNFWKSGGSY